MAPGTDLVVMETVSRLAGGIETNESLSILVEACQRVCRHTKASVVLVAHVSQEAGRAGLADAYAPRGGSALGDSGRSTMVLTRINENNERAYLPEVTLDRDQKKRLLVFTHPKSNGAPGADPVLLERWSTPFGPVLRRADLRTREQDKVDARRRVVKLVQDLTGSGIVVTRNKLEEKGYLERTGLSRHEMRLTVDDAIRAGELAPARNVGRGGGEMICATGKLPQMDEKECGEVEAQ
jgi:hypothetical protein